MTAFFRDDFVNSLISGIYDCAVDPSLWTGLLTQVRDGLGLRLASVTIMKPSASPQGGPPMLRHLHSPWDVDHLEMLPRLVPIIPMADRWMQSDIDLPVSQMQLIDEQAFRQSEFYRNWVAPKGLRDSCCSVLVRRPELMATLNAISGEDVDLIGEDQRRLVRLLSPHIRRALLISDLLDDARDAIELYRAMLDGLSVAVVLVEEDARVLYANRAAEMLFRAEGPMAEVSGRLWTASAPHRAGLHDAIRRACVLPDAALGSWGNGIAMSGPGGQIAAAYVLPLGQSERRRALGPGRAAVFITNRAGARPPSVEILCALSGLTAGEARVALLIADGKGPDEAAAELGISVNTLRKHLANTYEKTGYNSQTALAAFVNKLRAPLR